MSIQLSFNRVIVCLLVAGLATLGWWIAGDVLHWPAWAAMFIFGFILIVLSIGIDYPGRTK